MYAASATLQLQLPPQCLWHTLMPRKDIAIPTAPVSTYRDPIVCVSSLRPGQYKHMTQHYLETTASRVILQHTWSEYQFEAQIFFCTNMYIEWYFYLSTAALCSSTLPQNCHSKDTSVRMFVHRKPCAKNVLFRQMFR